MTARPANAPGVLDVRLLGDERDVNGLADALAAMDGVEVLSRSGPRENRHDAGIRIHLTVLLTQEGSHA